MMAMRKYVVLMALLSSVVALSPRHPLADLQVTSSLTFDAEGAKNRPVAKVIALLKDMQKQLQKEGEEDEEAYEQMACWCETNDREKTKSLADAEAHINDLTARIEEGVQKSSQLNTEIANLEKEVAANQHALDKAAAIRKKALAEFNVEEKDLMQSIMALKNAVVVLSKHHGGALLQSATTEVYQVATVLSHNLETHVSLLEGVITPTQKKIAAKFVQAAFKQGYAPQSGEIFGILNQMKETFESNLSHSQKEELAAQKGFTELKAAKEEEIAAATAQVEAKTQELADTDEKLANNKQDLTDTRETMSADDKFLMNLKETCAMTDKEWEQRQKERQLEIEAVSKALAFLTSDEAHDLFTKTFNPAFLQEASSQEHSKRAQVSKLLATIARKHEDPRVMAIAMSARLDAFTRVKKAIDDMVATLLQEKQDEIKHKDYCVNSLFENEGASAKKERLKSDLTSQIDDLTMTIDALTKGIETLKAEIAELQLQLKRAGQDREKENKGFQLTVADQRATQKLLQMAMDVLKGFYEKKAKTMALVARKQDPVGPPPPPGFKAHKKNASGGGVIGMIQSIINDAKAMEQEAIAGEEEAQKAYEDFVKDSNGSIEEKSKSIVNKSEEKAKAEESKVQAVADKEDAMLELEQLSNENGDLHKACDYVLKNFDIRQTARDEEIEALKQAKAILSGAKFTEFLEKLPHQ